ncbi:hypothetical protein GQ43DRAFT_475184 [Delitschia confertaspora ATCC 74209]|uniref:Alpha-1,3-mannosyltransferase CMT1 n=1 Tax=Delitschia confertaspora ATCC 74209 TaxID=1513339 RepID=A0A9P4MV75_9PLEO|nr:hypothetical protein GQ43DRAFT_475184 [Delitschia confertaspora ATCC 74209]
MAMKRSFRTLFQLLTLVAVVLFLAVSLGHSQYGSGLLPVNPVDSRDAKSPAEEAQYAYSTRFPLLKESNETLAATAPSYLHAIMDPEDKTYPRLECPFPNPDRYASLKGPSRSKLPRYFFALDLHQCVGLLPRLIGSIVEAIKFLGPENCVLSIVEGRSDDGTFEVLKELRTEIQILGSRYILQTSDINPKIEGTDRIIALAELRNLAVNDLIQYPDNYDPKTTVVFSNDIAVCLEDILELVYQRVFQKADMTCAMDWTYVGDNPTFYDIWIARDMHGDSFFDIPESGSWDLAWNLFPNDDEAKWHLMKSEPFQVFSCWNGITAFTAKPLMEGKIKFRGHYEGECFQGEPKLFAKDMWYHGYGKIAVVPSVNVEYNNEAGKRIKTLKGYTSANVGEDLKIKWETEPPKLVKCMAHGYVDQQFLPWDEGLPG